MCKIIIDKEFSKFESIFNDQEIKNHNEVTTIFIAKNMDWNEDRMGKCL